MRVRLLMGTLALELAFAALAQAPGPASRGFDFTYVVKVVPPVGSREARVWVPLPATDQFQTISDLQLQTPAKYDTHRDLRYGNTYAYFSVDAARDAEPIELKMTFHALRQERRVDLVHAVDPPGAYPPDVQPYLQPDKLVPIDGKIAELSRTDSWNHRSFTESSQDL